MKSDFFGNNLSTFIPYKPIIFESKGLPPINTSEISLLSNVKFQYGNTKYKTQTKCLEGESYRLICSFISCFDCKQSKFLKGYWKHVHRGFVNWFANTFLKSYLLHLLRTKSWNTIKAASKSGARLTKARDNVCFPCM